MKMVGDTPSYRARTIGGEAVSPKVLEGRVAVVDFWATWCGPRVAVMPHMRALHEKYRRSGVVFLGVSRDDDMRTVTCFAKAQGMTWAQILDKQQKPQLAGTFGISGIPDAFIISPDGE